MASPQSSHTGRADESSAFVILVDGLIDRIQRSPLMRRAPAQCSAEEQIALAGLLSDLVTLRNSRSAVENIAGARMDMISAHWPELDAVLATARRSGAASRAAKVREVPSVGQGSLMDALAGEDSTDQVPAAEITESSAAVTAPGQSGPDLAHLLLEALTIQGRALNSTQMLAWLADRGGTATRSEVQDTLFRHEELFRKRGTGHWVVASQEAG